ncbi:hypothetical protein SAY86_023816 [Trapa natans]|uniref:Uncharacterized protein n=1 Tax=Trapa natans TaxID=22666 RepID=A0AAN7RAK4_TRANT|nr:hypothetical protein SAY86_023816 [Trapa natans]
MRQAYDFCKSKLMDREERIKYFDIYSLKDVTDAFKSLLLSKRSVEEAMEALPPLIKRLFMDCLREVNPQSPISLPMDAKSKSWLLKNMDFLHSSWKSFVRHQPSQPGELENGRSVHSAAPSPNDPSKHSPASAPSPKNPSGPSLAPAPYRDLAPSSTLSPSPVLTASSNPSKMVELPHKPPVNSHLPEKPRAVHHQPPAHHPTEKEETDNIWTIIAVPVAVTAAASFLFVALIFCVLNRKRKFQDAHRHVGPPQKLCPSGHSTSMTLTNRA